MLPRVLASERLKGSSRRAKATRAILFIVLLISGASCLAPGLYASTDCNRWVKEYRQGILQARAARRLRLAKARLLVVVHRPASTPHPHHVRHRMGPLEALRRFQVDCGTLEDVEPVATPIALTLPFLPIETPPLETTTIADLAVPTPLAPLAPNLLAPLEEAPPTPVSGQVPEPGSWLLVVTGAGAGLYLFRRRSPKLRAA